MTCTKKRWPLSIHTSYINFLFLFIKLKQTICFHVILNLIASAIGIHLPLSREVEITVETLGLVKAKLSKIVNLHAAVVLLYANFVFTV